MRVLVLHSRYLSGPVSGENRVVEDEVALLRDAGHDVRTLAPEPDGGASGAAKSAASALWSRTAVSEMRKLIAEHRPEVVHFHNLFPTLSPAVLRNAGDAAAVMTLHNFRLMCLPSTFLRDGAVCEACLGKVPWRGVVYRCYRDSAAGSAVLGASLTMHRALRSFDRVDLFLAMSEFLRSRHVAGGIPSDKIVVKPNFAADQGARQGVGDAFVYLGRLADEKGIDVLLRAWPEVPDARLIVVGEGPAEERLRAMAPANVEIRPSVPAAETPALLARARALLIPSIWYEGNPRSILEAYSQGVPVIASDIGGLPEVVDHERTGLLVTPGDPAAWSSAIGALDDATVARLGAGARLKWEEMYSPERGLATLESAYEIALEKRHQRASEGTRRG